MLSEAKLQSIVWTSRIGEAKRFYSDVLGLALVGISHGALVYQVGSSELRVSPVPSTQPTEHAVMGFAVSDLDAVVTQLLKRGVTLEHPLHLPLDVKGVLHTTQGARVAWFRDPDGNVLSLVQYAL